MSIRKSESYPAANQLSAMRERPPIPFSKGEDCGEIFLQMLERCCRKFELDVMASFPLRSPSEKIGGLFYFGRMLDKIRLHAKGELPPDYHANLGKGFDEKCVHFLRVKYDQLIERMKKGGTDEEILEWCFNIGRRPSEDDVYVWNEFMRKRGWNDEVSKILNRRKAEAGMTGRSDIETSFQFIDADEGRLPQRKAPDPNPQIPGKSPNPNLKPAR